MVKTTRFEDVVCRNFIPAYHIRRGSHAFKDSPGNRKLPFTPLPRARPEIGLVHKSELICSLLPRIKAEYGEKLKRQRG